MSPHPTPITPPLFFCESEAKRIRARTKRRLSSVPDANEEMDTSQLFCHSPTLWCCCGARRTRGSIGAARHTPFEKHASKHVLMHLAASQPCQVNGWASDSGLYIPSLPSIVKLQCSLQDYYYSHIHHLGCRFYHGMNMIINVNTRLCGTVLRVIWSTKFQFKGSIINHLKEA